MNDWEKLETSAEDLATEPIFTAEEVEEIVQRRAHTRRSKLAAPLGFILLLLSAIGVFAIVDLAIGLIAGIGNIDEVSVAATDFLKPILVQAPASLDSTDDNERDDLIMAAIWRVVEDERIRQLQQHTTDGRYPVDEYGRYRLPIDNVNAAYATLFGDDAKPHHHSIGEAENKALITQYDKKDGCYYVPSTAASSLYHTILIDASRKGNVLSLEIGFVPTMDLSYDDQGRLIEPEPSAAVYRQVYAVKVLDEDKGKFALQSITDK